MWPFGDYIISYCRIMWPHWKSSVEDILRGPRMCPRSGSQTHFGACTGFMRPATLMVSHSVKFNVIF